VDSTLQRLRAVCAATARLLLKLTWALEVVRCMVIYTQLPAKWQTTLILGKLINIQVILVWIRTLTMCVCVFTFAVILFKVIHRLCIKNAGTVDVEYQ